MATASRTARWMGALLVATEVAVKLTERENERFGGYAKKKLAMDRVLIWYRESGIDIPRLPKWIERRVIKFLANWFIEWVLQAVRIKRT